MKAKDRVRANTAKNVNEEIERKTERRIVQAASSTDSAISRRIDELEKEWDMERWLETNASSLALAGLILGLTKSRKYLLLSGTVLSFLLKAD